MYFVYMGVYFKDFKNFLNHYCHFKNKQMNKQVFHDPYFSQDYVRENLRYFLIVTFKTYFLCSVEI